MQCFVHIREKRQYDIPATSELIRNAYTSNIFYAWQNALFNEITSQLTIFVAAILFIIFGVPLVYSLISIPLVILGIYILIYTTILLKATQILYEKRPLKSWVAEVYEPVYFIKDSRKCEYKILIENEIDQETEIIQQGGYRRKLIGTISVMKHFHREDWIWLFGLAVEKDYRRKGIGLHLVWVVQKWCKKQRHTNLELAISECQEGARELFDKAGFEIKQLYHKKLIGSLVTLQMCQLRYDTKSSFY